MEIRKTRAYRNCNPLNIRWTKARWQGQIGKDEAGFVKFANFGYGYRAAVRILRSYWLKHVRTLEEIITRWAPPEDGNDTEQYINTVTGMMQANGRTTGATLAGQEGQSEPCVVNRDTQMELSNRDLIVQLLLAMTRVEMGASSAQAHSLRPYAEMGYDLAANDPEFFG